LMEIGVGAADVLIRGNSLGGLGAPAAAIQLDIWRACTIANNHSNVGVATVTRGIMLNGFAGLGAQACTIIGNAFASHDEAGVWSDNTSHMHRIIGNRFVDHPNGAFGVRLAGSEGCLVDSNVFEGQVGGFQYNGTPVYITDTAASDGRSNRISNNVMRYVRGQTQKAVIRITQSFSGCIGNTISGNQMLNCGDETAAMIADSQSLIRTNAMATKIDGNYLFNIFGINNADTGTFIDAVAVGCQITNNYIYKDFTDPSAVSWAGNPDTMVGILAVSNENIITNNFINWNGTNSDGAGHTVTAISIGASLKNIVGGNFFSLWDLTGSTQLAISSSDADNVFYGNWSRVRSYSVAAGTHPDNASNYNVSTRQPFLDFNNTN